MENEENQNLNINQPPAPQQPIVEPEKSSLLGSKWIKIGAVVVILLFLLGGAYLLGKNNSSSQSTQAPTPTPDLNAEGTRSATANWKTYIGNGFSFKYPSGWAINAKKPTTIVIGSLSTKNHIGETVPEYVSPYITLTLKESTPNTDLIKFSKLDASLGTVWENITIDNLIGFDATHTGCQSGSCRDIFFQNGKTIYNFSEQNKLKELNNIISTFKFTDSSADTSTWKTYTNKWYTLKYPPVWGVEKSPESISSSNTLNLLYLEKLPHQEGPGSAIVFAQVINNNLGPDSDATAEQDKNVLLKLLNIPISSSINGEGNSADIKFTRNKDVSIDGLNAKLYDTSPNLNVIVPKDSGYPQKIILLSKNGIIYEFGLNSKESTDLEYFNQLLKTIKFKQ